MEQLMMGRKYVLSFDAETNGLRGVAFAIAGIVYDGNGNEIDRFVGRCPIEGEVSPYVKENVLPAMQGIEENFLSYEELLSAYVEWRELYRESAIEIVHMGVPVEAKLFDDAYDYGFIGEFDGPYPLVDISAYPEIGVSVDTYNDENEISVNPGLFDGGTHNPLFDSAQAAAAFFHWHEAYAEVQRAAATKEE